MKNKNGKTPALRLFAAALVLLLFGSIGGALAALAYRLEGEKGYTAEIAMLSTDVQVLEQGRAVSALSFGESDGRVIPGKKYDEELSVGNSGEIDEYVRVVIRRCWKDGGEKDAALDPGRIALHLLTEGSGWVEDTTARTAERTVLYYTRPLAAGAATSAFCDTLTLDTAVQTLVKQEGSNMTTTTFLYDGKTLCLEIEADGVQTHHAADAILSAWGRRVSIDESGTLSLG